MNILLLGYGKMGKAIHAILNQKPQHRVVACITRENRDQLEAALAESDVVIEFTRPDVAVENILFCLERGVPVVTGTTGWHEHLPALQQKITELQGSLLYASNFSVGVNLFFLLNEVLAQMMQSQPQYQPVMTEIHHTQKLDAPSGTAISLAKGILAYNARYSQWHLSGDPQAPDNSIPIHALRTEGVFGTHIIDYQSEIDSIEIKHTAHSREGFARGAVLAAEWLRGQKGLFTMRDVLGL